MTEKNRDPQWSPYEFLPKLRAAMQVEVGFRIEGFSLILYVPPEDFRRLAEENIELFQETPGSLHLGMGDLDVVVLIDPQWIEDEENEEEDNPEDESQPPE